MISAFGVEHGEVVAKAVVPAGPVAALKATFAKPPQVLTPAARGGSLRALNAKGGSFRGTNTAGTRKSAARLRNSFVNAARAEESWMSNSFRAVPRKNSMPALVRREANWNRAVRADRVYQNALKSPRPLP